MSIVNKQELAEILGKSERTLTTWQKNGMPIEIDGGRGVQNKYDTEVVIDWMLQQEILKRLGDRGDLTEVFDYDVERARLTHHQANKAELDEQVMRGNLIPGDVVERVWCDIIANFRARILSIPTKAAHQLLAVQDLAECQSLLKAHVYEALQELSEYEPERFDLEPRPDSDRIDGATASPHS